MTRMPRLVLTGATLLVLTAIAAVIGETFDIGRPYYLVSLFVVMFLASLTDRDRFYGRDLFRDDDQPGP